MAEREIRRTTTIRETPVQERPVPVVERHVVEDDVVNPRSTGESIVYWILNVIEIILALRLIFRLLGANPNNGLVSFLYNVSAPLVAPFVGIFRQPVTGSSVLEWSTVIAMIIYAIVAYLIIQLIRLSMRRPVT